MQTTQSVSLFTRFGINQIKEKLFYYKLNVFRPKVRFSFISGEYEVKTADNFKELNKILELRYKSFLSEKNITENTVGIEFDKYDYLGDHIFLKHRETGQVIGTYRLLCSKFTKKFYSQNEFDIDRFLEQPGTKLELGRSCIHKDFRNGMAINLIWQGLARYISLTQSRYLFGCTSVPSIDYSEVTSVLEHLKEHSSNDFNISPTKKYRFSDHLKLIDIAPDKSSAKKMVPPLLRTYLHAGAKIYGEAAVDYEFLCSDIFTILDMEKINPKFYKKFF